MARPVFSHELIDPDFAWLVASFQEERPEYVLIDAVGLPLVFIVKPVNDPIALIPILSSPEEMEHEDDTQTNQ